MDLLTAFGLVSVALMVLFYALEKQSHLYILGFSVACVLAAVYGYLVGAWPFSIAEAIWAAIAFNRWRYVRSL